MWCEAYVWHRLARPSPLHDVLLCTHGIRTSCGAGSILLDCRCLQEKICMRGNQLAAFTAKIIRLCNKLRIPWVLENPASSYLWSHPPVQSALRGSTDTVIDQCQYGMAWRKPTRLAMGGLLCPTPYLCKRCAGSRQLCYATGKAHVVLSGTANGAFLTAVSMHYPKALCRGIASTFKSFWASRYVADRAEIFER